ncbi:ABC transporter transmembrane domain-containing protein [Paenibacillus senegalensis]|uniref:ABC transporter transmembrane domain-containing protein n=1 Tax=Paenibacillus senegalensis TaxID=1465766 RepID=UPI000287D865|nr:ABC transporter ATP-binding protein [Paenibacillus senegalensis]
MDSPAARKSESDSGSRSDNKKGLLPVYLWTLSYVKPYLGLLALVVLSLALVSAVELAIPKFFQFFIDSVIPGTSQSSFLGMVIFFVALLAALLAGQAGFNVFQRQLQERASRDLQLSIFKQIRKLGFAYYERNPVGETLAFLNTEVASIQNLYRQSFPSLLNGLLFSILSVAVMLSTSLHLSMVVLPSFLLYYLFGPALEKKASLEGKKLAALRIEENRKVYDSVSSLTEVRAYGAESWDSQRYLDKVEEHNRGMIRTYWFAYWRGTNRRLSYYIGAIVIFFTDTI